MCQLGYAVRETRLDEKVAWRLFRVVKGKLCSLYSHGCSYTAYTIGKKHRAAIKGCELHTGGSVASLNCVSGFHAFKTRAIARDQKRQVFFLKNVVVKHVLLSGRATEHTNGWRAQYMVIPEGQ